ncbi:hypothetical protein ACJX0J_030812, partial [Zea mays]
MGFEWIQIIFFARSMGSCNMFLEAMLKKTRREEMLAKGLNKGSSFYELEENPIGDIFSLECCDPAVSFDLKIMQPNFMQFFPRIDAWLGVESIPRWKAFNWWNVIEHLGLLGAVVVIAANAGGAWTPIGDVTTTMLWIHGQITTLKIMQGLFIPSTVSLAVPLALMSLTSEANGSSEKSSSLLSSEQVAPRGQLVLGVGIGALMFVPVFKALTGLPPFMGMLLGLGILWILTDAIHYGDSERQRLKVPQALSRIDTQGILFFLGILLSVGSLESAGILRQLANYLDANIPNADLIASAIGVASAIIDNVPLVAATMGMYDLTSFPQDSDFWQLVAFCAGTGGSMLIIGSAAGVAFMGVEKVDFFWYFRK